MKFTAFAGTDRISGTGTIADISSGGFAFRAQPALQMDMKVVASVSWPALLNDECLLQLLVEGVVIRVDADLAVLRITRSEFRTSGRVDKSVIQETQAAARQLAQMAAAPSGLKEH